MMTYFGIYKITNLLDGKMYIGKHKTIDLDDGYMGSGIHVSRALQKYGKENFRKEWLMFCEDEEEMNYMERVFVDQTWVDRSDTYNLTLGGEGGSGKGALNGMFGKHLSEETKQKLSIAHKGHLGWNKGRPMSEDARQKLSNALKGRHLSEKAKQKLSNYRKGKTSWNKGKKFSEETRKKMSEAKKGKPSNRKGARLSEETRKKISESLKRQSIKNEVKDELHIEKLPAQAD